MIQDSPKSRIHLPALISGSARGHLVAIDFEQYGGIFIGCRRNFRSKALASENAAKLTASSLMCI